MFKYIKCADMLKQIIEKKRQLKQVIYRNNNKNHNQNNKDLSVSATYSLLSLITNNFPKFQHFINQVQSQTRQHIQNPYLMIVMVGEYVNLGKIKGGGKVKKLIIDNIHLLPQIKKQTKINKQTVQIRLIQNSNHSKTSNQSQSQLNQDSFKHWTNIFQQQKTILQNQIIPNVYNLNSDQYKELLREHPGLLKSNVAVIQSFSSAIPPFLLIHGLQKSQLKDFKVIDACSAPGNKTAQLGEYIFNPQFNRKVLAFQKDPRRYNVLNKTIQRYNSQQNIDTFNENFLQTEPSQKRFLNVKFVLLDPSCSGSGMLSNYLRDLNQEEQSLNKMNFEDFCRYQYENLSEEEKQRVEKLHDFQIELLNHSAKFKPKRISFSTCSIYERQNQDVVGQFLSGHPEYELKQNKVISRNIGKYSLCEGFGKYKFCVRVDPRKKQTDGFFVAIFIKKTQIEQQ